MEFIHGVPEDGEEDGNDVNHLFLPLHDDPDFGCELHDELEDLHRNLGEIGKKLQKIKRGKGRKKWIYLNTMKN